MTLDGAWMCPACWKTNRPQDTRCYRCHTRRDADEATIAQRRGMSGAPVAKDDARGLLDVLLALPAVVFSWFWRVNVFGGILFLVLTVLFAISAHGHLAALVALGFAAGTFLLAILMRWASGAMRARNLWGWVVGLVVSLTYAVVELWGLKSLPPGVGNPVWEADAVIVIFGVAAVLAALGLIFQLAGFDAPKES